MPALWAPGYLDFGVNAHIAFSAPAAFNTPACGRLTAAGGIFYHLCLSPNVLEPSPTKENKRGGSVLTLTFSQDGRLRIALHGARSPAGWAGTHPGWLEMR